MSTLLFTATKNVTSDQFIVKGECINNIIQIDQCEREQWRRVAEAVGSAAGAGETRGQTDDDDWYTVEVLSEAGPP